MGRPGQVFERRLIPDHGGLLGWVESVPGSVVVTYEAGPTGATGAVRVPRGPS
jgi:hypothetical protein